MKEAKPARTMGFIEAMMVTIFQKQAVYSHTLGGTVVADRTDASKAWFIHRVTTAHPVPMIAPWVPERFPEAVNIHDWVLSTDNWSN